MVERFVLGRGTTAIDRLVRREVAEADVVPLTGEEPDGGPVVPS